MKDGGLILMTGSIASIKGCPAFGVYNATKAAVRRDGPDLTTYL
jgi:NADP-dependent 3-hydroxy acid dehydrogenase YdfG